MHAQAEHQQRGLVPIGGGVEDQQLAVAALGFEIVWLPTDAPWTHPIETRWC
ncbi:hypothetical protein [Sphaerobacter sp.]|uniref:hypothetical protein n=1 Tax=Sphaerobacter sp. TaxID=2099654 RepID=UPI001D586A21|nr:hypothetical protein [Sphaerobacter sp.]MBX5446684.1 hypothetical protein [Sphaerobacter sp.]